MIQFETLPVLLIAEAVAEVLETENTSGFIYGKIDVIFIVFLRIFVHHLLFSLVFLIERRRINTESRHRVFFCCKLLARKIKCFVVMT